MATWWLKVQFLNNTHHVTTSPCHYVKRTNISLYTNDMAEHNEFGKKGEDIAAEYLQKKGYKILERNWVSGKNEIDIIAREGKYVVVVEVKSRHSNYAGEPETAVTKDKQRSLIRAANSYVRKMNMDEEVRFDIISILVVKGKEEINHIEDAFYPTLF